MALHSNRSRAGREHAVHSGIGDDLGAWFTYPHHWHRGRSNEFGADTAHDVPTEIGSLVCLQNLDIDIVAMESHDRSNLERQLLGSLASIVFRTVAVLVVERSG